MNKTTQKGSLAGKLSAFACGAITLACAAAGAANSPVLAMKLFGSDGKIAPLMMRYSILLQMVFAASALVFAVAFFHLVKRNFLGAPASGEGLIFDEGCGPNTGGDKTDLFLASFFVLFLELALIRWIPAYIFIVTYFTNVVLMACLLGMGIGLLTEDRRSKLIPLMPAVIFGLVASVIVMYSLWRMNIMLTGFMEKKNSFDQHIYFGGEIKGVPRKWHFVMPVEAVLSIMFFGVALAFVGPGQILGRCFRRFEPVRAYSINLLGSIAGIAVFTAMSYFRMDAWVWFAAAFVVLLFLLRKLPKKTLALGAALLACCVALIVVLEADDAKHENHWSLYYRINRIPDKDNRHSRIVVNLIGHQVMHPISEQGVYPIPYLMLNASNPQKKIKDVLIIGAGSGNDVGQAIYQGVENIDAVEIEPLIAELGKKHHPDKPLLDPRVHLHIDDGRSFLKKTDKKYDLVIYALVDSLTLLSTYSNIRLENYLFSKEAFQDAKDRLKPDGTFVVYNFFRRNWLVMRISQMMTDVFGEQPVLITNPTLKSIADGGTGPTADFSIMLAGNTSRLRSDFNKYGKFYVNRGNLDDNMTFNGFTVAPDPAKHKLKPYYMTKIIGKAPPVTPSDNWPFLYLRQPKMPKQNIVGSAIMIAITLLFFGLFARGKVSSFNPHFFFLGAAFMLLETESIVKLSLIYGSTWFVNSIVFFTILLMVFFANLVVSTRDIKRMYFVYAFLLIALAANYFVPLSVFLGRGPLIEWGLPPLLLFCPIIFAGLIFPTSFKKSRNPAADLGANLLGVMAGGLMEYFSILWGYSALLIMVAVLYLLASAFAGRVTPGSSCEV